jgi:hypothetical protein
VLFAFVAKVRPEVIGSLEQALCPPLARALDGDRASLAGLIKREGAGVFTIDVFSEPWMQQLITVRSDLRITLISCALALTSSLNHRTTRTTCATRATRT